jgi:hypothetical protein
MIFCIDIAPGQYQCIRVPIQDGYISIENLIIYHLAKFGIGTRMQTQLYTTF